MTPPPDASSSTATSTITVDTPHLAPAASNGSSVRSADVVKVLAIAALFALGLFLLVTLAPLLLSIFVAAFLAIASDPAVRFFQRLGLNRPLAVTAFTTILVAVLLGFMALFIPPLVDQGSELAKDTPGYVEDLRETELVTRMDREYDIIDKGSEQLDKLPARVGAELGTVVTTIFAGIFGAVTVVFLMVLLLLGGSNVTSGLVQVFPKIAERRWWRLIIASYRSVTGYVAGTAFIAVIAGAVVAVTALLLDLPSFLPLALWMALFDIVPLVGALIGAVPAIAVAFLAGGVTEGIIMIVVLFVYQQLENVWLQPAVLGKAVSLQPVVVFVAILAGGQLLGITGALLAIPMAAVAQIFLREWISERNDEEFAVPPIAPDTEFERPTVEAPSPT